MRELLSPMVGRYVTIEQMNSQQISGRLIDVKSDYLTITDQNGKPAYLQLLHIVSVVINHAELVMPLDDEDIPELPSCFVELLDLFADRMIQIGIGNRTTTGVLYEVNDEDISLISSIKHTVFYPISQIQRFSLVVESGESSQSECNREEKSHDDKHDDAARQEDTAIRVLTVEHMVSEGERAGQNRKKRASGSSDGKLTVFHVRQANAKKSNSESNTRRTVPVPAWFGECKSMKVRHSSQTCGRSDIARVTMFDPGAKLAGSGSHVSHQKTS